MILEMVYEHCTFNSFIVICIFFFSLSLAVSLFTPRVRACWDQYLCCWRGWQSITQLLSLSDNTAGRHCCQMGYFCKSFQLSTATSNVMIFASLSGKDNHPGTSLLSALVKLKRNKEIKNVDFKIFIQTLSCFGYTVIINTNLKI